MQLVAGCWVPCCCGSRSDSHIEPSVVAQHWPAGRRMPMTPIAFWIYVAALLLFIIGLIKIFGELPEQHGVDKIMPFGRLCFAIPMAVFGSEHFTAAAAVADLIPSWIPAHAFWV